MGTVNVFSFPTTIHSGAGAREAVPTLLKEHGLGRPLLVTDKQLATLPPVEDIAGRLKASGLDVAVFSGIWGNPVVSQVSAGVAAYRDAQRDSIVAVGGGSALDVAKCIALMAHHPGDLLDYEDGKPEGRPVDQAIPFIVAIPTTAGTGSEVGRSAVVSEDETQVKRIIFSPRLLAPVVVVDPELTLGLPPQVTAATGLDALTHLVEAYLALGYHPMCDGIALEGIAMVAQNLERCVAFAKDPNVGSREEHVAVRGAMLDAALMGAVAFQKGLGVNHSCAHALSTVTDMHHGLANGIILPYAMGFNLAAAPRRFAQMAVIAGLEDASGESFIRWLKDLRAALDIPDTLKAAGIKIEQCEALVEVAFADTCHELNPRPVSRDDLHAIFVRAFG